MIQRDQILLSALIKERGDAEKHLRSIIGSGKQDIEHGRTDVVSYAKNMLERMTKQIDYIAACEKEIADTRKRIRESDFDDRLTTGQP